MVITLMLSTLVIFEFAVILAIAASTKIKNAEVAWYVKHVESLSYELVKLEILKDKVFTLEHKSNLTNNKLEDYHGALDRVGKV